MVREIEMEMEIEIKREGGRKEGREGERGERERE